MKIIENQNLDPRRLPELIEKESKNLPNAFKLIDNPSLCESKTSSGITGGQGVVKCVLARALERERN